MVSGSEDAWHSAFALDPDHAILLPRVLARPEVEVVADAAEEKAKARVVGGSSWGSFFVHESEQGDRRHSKTPW